MQYLKDLLKKSGWMSIAESLVFAILGIILIWQKDAIMSMIAYILGAVFILLGIIKVVNYVQTKSKSDLYNYELVYGIMAVIIGIVIMVYSSTISKIFGIIIGMWIVYSSVVRASSALKLKQIKSNIWIYSLVIAIIMLICGLVVIFNTGAIPATIGAIMITYAVLDIIENVIFINNVKKLG
ncbi:MAG: hypothetical protein HFJ41_03195 [Clostridia bacterium]|nr:hypothetical protein [Clostridia bacterium]